MFDRRKLMFAFTGTLVALFGVLRQFMPASAQGISTKRAPTNASSGSAHLFSFPGLKGGSIALNDYAGKVVMIVNTASFCGFTNQFKELEALYERYKAKGFVVIGVPSNDFNQEPGSSEDIAQFCSSEYGVTFPMTAKLAVKGEAAHPFYKWAAKQGLAEGPKWNFFKYLIARDGSLIGAYGTMTAPNDPSVVAAIQAALAGA